MLIFAVDKHSIIKEIQCTSNVSGESMRIIVKYADYNLKLKNIVCDFIIIV